MLNLDIFKIWDFIWSSEFRSDAGRVQQHHWRGARDLQCEGAQQSAQNKRYASLPLKYLNENIS